MAFFCNTHTSRATFEKRFNSNLTIILPENPNYLTKQQQNMKQKLLSVILLCTMLIGVVYAQNRQVSGKVTSEADGRPLSGVSVTVVGTSSGTQTDGNGDYTISVSNEGTLSFSYVGYTSQRVKVGTRSNISIALVASENAIEEVIVTTAYGIKRSAASTGYSNQTVDAKALTEGKVVNLATGLQSKVPGLQINLINNGVNPATRVVLRGNRSLLGNNQALIVVDGVPVPNSVLNALNPNDIEDVNVLKGANAAALYGSEGVNGVLIVTTKKGSKGGPVINFSNTSSLESAAYLPKMQEQFGNGYDLDTYVPYENTSWGPKYDGSTVVVGPTLADGSEWKLPYSAVSGEKEKFWALGSTIQNDISVSGGDDVTSYYAAFQDVNIKGITPKDKNRRTGGRFNASRKFGNFTTSFNLNYTYQNPDVTSSSVYNNLLNVPQNVPITQLKDWQNNPFATPDGYFSGYYVNPYWEIDNNRRNTREEVFNGNLELKYDFTDWLSATYRLGNYALNSNYKQYYAKVAYTKAYDRPTDNPGSVTDRSDNFNRLNSDIILQAQRKFGDFDLGLILGVNVRTDYSKFVSNTANALVVPGLYNVSNRLGEATVGSDYSRKKQSARFAQADVNYRDMLYLTVNLRHESISVLSPDNRSYLYPGASLSFIATEAFPTIKESSPINFLKFYVSGNKTANVNLSPYNLTTAYELGPGFPFGNLPGFTVGNTFANPNLKPEFVNSYEAGFQISMLNDRLYAEGTYAYSISDGQIIPISTSFATGYDRAFVNAGTVTNNTIEATLRGTPVRTEDWKWDIGLNYTHYDNKVTDLYQGLNEIPLGGFANSAYIYAIKGEAYPMIKTTAYKRDPEGRVIVDKSTGYPIRASEMKAMGQTNAPTNLGFNTSLRYKNLTLAAQLDYRTGHVFYSRLANLNNFTGLSWESAQYDRQPFVFPNSVYEENGTFVPNTDIKTADGGFDYWYSQHNATQENYVKDATFLKLREVSLNYNLPASWLANQKVIKRANIGLVARNLFTKLAKENIYTDPEFSFTDGNTVGITDVNQTPPTRIYGFNINITF